MIAKKCDRCGSLYEEKLDCRDVWRYNVTKDCYPYPDKIELDLCYNCKYDLEQWLKGTKNGEET